MMFFPFSVSCLIIFFCISSWCFFPDQRKMPNKSPWNDANGGKKRLKWNKRYGFFPTPILISFSLTGSALPQSSLFFNFCTYIHIWFVIFFSFATCLVSITLIFFVDSNDWYGVSVFFRLPLSNIHSNIYNLKSQAYKRLLFICPFQWSDHISFAGVLFFVRFGLSFHFDRFAIAPRV